MKAQRIIQKIFYFFLFSLIAFTVYAQPTIVKPTKIYYPVSHDTSRALSEIIVKNISGQSILTTSSEMLTHQIPDKLTPRVPLLNYDPVAQTESGHQLPLQITAGFEGIDNLCNCWPPDPNGDVSENYYFQTVNSHFAIYDKHGNLLKGPLPLDSLWSGFNGAWSSMTKTDPLVLYDHLAHRWLVTVLAFNFSGYYDYELIAISQSDDPLGAWYRYAYFFDYLPDYPKFAVWPDGYYMSANRYTLGSPSYIAMAAYVFDRNSMLNGKKGQLISFTSFPDSAVGHGLLPSDLDGTPPPLNTPNYFAYVVDGETMGGSDRIGIFKLRVDWDNPSSSTFTGPITLNPEPFNRKSGNIPQFNSPESLDVIGDRLMYRLQYRNFGSYQAMVTNHTVDAGNGMTGIRWYEFRNNGSSWSIYQQGTYAPQDGLHRWMGSITMDKFGNIVLGYSTSNGSSYPDIRATGRKFTDPLGQMTAEETVIKAGTGSQNGGGRRWGDYSMMAVDPEDETTFWYTTEYYKNTGKHWRTHIDAFYLPWPVAVDQLRKDGNRLAGTSVGRWNGNMFEELQITQEPDTIRSKYGSIEILRGYQQLVSNPTEKYRVWERNNVEQLDTIQNHRSFKIDQYINNLTSRFHPTYNGIVIRNEFISAPGSNLAGDSIYYKDPWFIDYPDPEFGGNLRNRGTKKTGPDSLRFWKRSSPFNPDYDTPYGNENYKYQGVFLDQNPDTNDPNKPYYSVKAEAEQTFNAHGEDITGYFLGWEGTSVDFEYPNELETAVVFHAANAEARAVYKGHLASSVARATGYNNGRRLCKTNDGRLHLVYEDDNTIWYTYSTNNGQTWTKEYNISPRPYSQNSISHTFKNPSINTDGTKLYVVFEEVVQSNSATNHLIDFRKWENNSWRPIENISDGSWQGDWWNGPWSERPSIGANEYGDVLVSWRDKTHSKIKMRYYNGSWSSIRQIYANGYPEAICMPGENEYPLKLVFSENGLIKYVSARCVNNAWTISSIQNLSNYAPPMFGDHNNPSTSVDQFGYGYIAWEAMDQMMEEKHILYQKFNFTHYASSASSVYSLALSEDSNLKNPSLSYEQSSHYISVFFQDHDQIKRKRTSGSSWYLSSFGSGKYPSISPNKSVGTVWTTYSSAPYLLETENLQNHLAKSTIAEVQSFKRFYYSRSDNGYFTIDLKEFTADGQTLTFYQNLNSDTIEINGLTDFDYRLEIGENIEADDLLIFWFVTDEQKYFLDEVKLDGDEAKTIIERSLSFDPGKPSKGYVQIEFAGKEPFVINVVPDNATGSLAKNFTLQSESFVPQKFALKQNFPNPFNPVTQIQFDLSKDTRVTLKVFDLSGHEVATLVNGYRSAGRYQVVFDGRNLASGVYIYQLSTDKGFTRSRKMMLIK